MRLELTLSPEAQARLQMQVDAFNRASGKSLDLPQWATLHLHEIAISAEFAPLVETIKKEQEDIAGAATEAAVTKERARLLASIGYSIPH